jgi:hypothetical protein
MNWKLFFIWNDGQSISPAVSVAPDQGWRVAAQDGSYVLVVDDNLRPVPGETIVANDEFISVYLIVTTDMTPLAVMPLPTGMCATLALNVNA